MTTPDKKTTDVKVVGVSPEVAAQVQATQKVEQESASVIAKSTETVADDLKAADKEREAKQDARDAKAEKADYRAKFTLPITLAVIGSMQIVGLSAIAAVVSVYGNRLERMEKTTTETNETTNKIHTLTNAAMGVQLKSNAALARWKADQTKDPMDEQAATSAEIALREHEAQQKIVDHKD